MSEVKRPIGFKRWFFRLPLVLYRAGLGRVMGSRFVQIEHTGRVSGEARHVVLEVVDADKQAGVYFVVSGWGEKADWFRNIKANPKIVYQVGQQRNAGSAEQLPREEAEAVFLAYGRKHPRMLQELMRFVGYRMEASEEAYRALAGHLPVVKLSPQREGG